MSKAIDKLIRSIEDAVENGRPAHGFGELAALSLVQVAEDVSYMRQQLQARVQKEGAEEERYKAAREAEKAAQAKADAAKRAADAKAIADEKAAYAKAQADEKVARAKAEADAKAAADKKPRGKGKNK